jgi:hypothetical protein
VGEDREVLLERAAARFSTATGSPPERFSMSASASYTIFSAIERLPRWRILLTTWVTTTDR